MVGLALFQEPNAGLEGGQEGQGGQRIGDICDTNRQGQRWCWARGSEPAGLRKRGSPGVGMTALPEAAPVMGESGVGVHPPPPGSSRRAGAGE